MASFSQDTIWVIIKGKTEYGGQLNGKWIRYGTDKVVSNGSYKMVDKTVAFVLSEPMIKYASIVCVRTDPCIQNDHYIFLSEPRSVRTNTDGVKTGFVGKHGEAFWRSYSCDLYPHAPASPRPRRGQIQKRLPCRYSKHLWSPVPSHLVGSNDCLWVFLHKAST